MEKTEVTLKAEPTLTNIADLGTKVHGIERFKALLVMMGLRRRSEFSEAMCREAKTVATVGIPATPIAARIAFLGSLAPTESRAVEVDPVCPRDVKPTSLEEEAGGLGFMMFLVVVVLVALGIGWLAGQASAPMKVAV